MTRVPIREILADPVQRRDLFVRGIIAMQAVEGIVTTHEQAEHAYDTVQKEKRMTYRALICKETRGYSVWTFQPGVGFSMGTKVECLGTFTRKADAVRARKAHNAKIQAADSTRWPRAR